jgi:hypothetical protein
MRCLKLKTVVRPVYSPCTPRVLVSRRVVRPVYNKHETSTPRVSVRYIFPPSLVRPVYTLKGMPYMGCFLGGLQHA